MRTREREGVFEMTIRFDKPSLAAHQAAQREMGEHVVRLEIKNAFQSQTAFGKRAEFLQNARAEIVRDVIHFVMLQNAIARRKRRAEVSATGQRTGEQDQHLRFDALR